MRNQSNRRWVAPPRQGYALEIVNPKGETVHTVNPLELNAFGADAGEFAVSRHAAVGWYRLRLAYHGLPKRVLEPLRVLVSDFTPSPFRVTTELDGSRFAPGDTVEITTTAQMHAGGPYVRADTRTTARGGPSRPRR